MKFKSILFLLIGTAILLGSSMVNSTGAIATTTDITPIKTAINSNTNTIPTTNNTTVNYNISGWKLVGTNWYYYKTGVMQTGWIKDSETWYYLNNSGVMQTGWVNDSETWYYLNNSGAMLSNTTVGIYILNSTGACVNPNGESTSGQTYTGTLEQGKSASEIKELLKDKYGFIDYNDGFLLNPAGKNYDYTGAKGDYVNDQIVTHEITDGSKCIILVKYDEKTISVFKDILNMIFPNKKDEAYALLADVMKSEQENKTYNFYGKTITIYKSGKVTQWDIIG